ncbi:hypothetical protein J5Y09_23745 [Roseomonas sp. PWR1]|uniref:Alpha/beta hydrolase n=1 Tax=Roseomonas nitratireducens TaxID=2820810 RepID=A0ABS4B2A2_9PROT|nr:hypothetical protein [Neoroseomonas nitratireducens]MBP0466962.1 hypothetical protein [Neoroseomonas nitratireducens]
MSSAPPTPPSPIRRRLVLHVPGYEPLSPGAQARRLARAIAGSAAAWGLEGGGQPGAGGMVHARLAGPDWATEAEIRILAWDDLIARDLAVPLPLRIWRGIGALAALLADGTLARYGAAHWRYLLFALFPVAVLLGVVLASAATARALGGAAGAVAGLLLGLALLVLADRRLHLGHLLADWAFARDIAAGRRPDVTARIAAFAEEIATARRRRDVQEVVLCGHSLGMALLAEALSAALEAEPAPPRPAPRLVLLGLGSSLLKIALMPEAARLRAAVARIAAAPGLTWVEVSSRRDLVSFHRADPVARLGLPGHGPRLESIHPRAMLAPAEWRRVRRSVLRAHRVYVTGNARRHFFDWGMVACGPGALGRDPWPDRLIGPDGALGTAIMGKVA